MVADGWGGREGPLGWEARLERAARREMCSCLPGKERFVFVCCWCLPPVLCAFNKPRHEFPGLMMAKNHPSRVLGLREEKGLGRQGCAEDDSRWHPTQHQWGTGLRVSS